MVTKLVNFFGHAAVAVWMAEARDPDPHVVFGAMLPDFATMIRGRVREAHDERVARGVALHHATDAAFHHLAPVMAHMRELDGALARHGCARGPRLATAHVGFELLLDGALVGDHAAREAYNRALAAAKMAQDVEQGVTALNGLGTLARTTGQAQEAQQAYQRALEVANAQGFAAGKADALNGLALLSAGQNQPAIPPATTTPSAA